LRADLQTTQESIKGITNLPKDAKISIQLRQIASILSDLKGREEKLEQTILANPSKALEIPLMQRDLESLRASQQANILAVKESVDRIYDINKWLLGGMAVSVIALAIGNFFKAAAPSNEKR
jgi:hypothetical protein